MNDLPKAFELHLTKILGLTPRTVRNYRSDLAHFLRWAGGAPLSANLLANYKAYLLETTASSTANRSLSTLRAFCRFLVGNGFLAKNPAENISNIDTKETLSDTAVKEKLLQEFTKHLQDQKVSATTLKNYLSDVRQFLAWHVQAE